MEYPKEYWNLELGAWSMELGALEPWSLEHGALELGAWSLEFWSFEDLSWEVIQLLICLPCNEPAGSFRLTYEPMMESTELPSMHCQALRISMESGFRFSHELPCNEPDGSFRLTYESPWRGCATKEDGNLEDDESLERLLED